MSFRTPPSRILTRRQRQDPTVVNFGHASTDQGQVRSNVTNEETNLKPSFSCSNLPPLLHKQEPAKQSSLCDVLIKTAHSGKSSVKSNRSTSSSAVARRKQLELEAAEAKAKIQMELIDKQLEAKLAVIEAEEEEGVQGDAASGASHDLLDTQKQVENWLDSKCEPPHVTNQTDQPSSGIQELAQVLKEFVVTQQRPPQQQHDERLLSRLATPRDLPIFSGDCVEWLHFKNAYNESSRVCQFTDAENLSRLRRALRGEAKEAVTDLLIGNTPPQTVMEALELRFGRSDIIIYNITTQLRKLLPLSNWYQHDIINFSMKVNNCVATIKALNQENYLHSPELANALLTKLPSTLIGKWTEFAYNKLGENRPKLELLATFLKREAEITSLVGLSQPREQKRLPETLTKRPDDSKFRSRHNVFATGTVKENESSCKYCNKPNHKLPECRLFRRAMRKDRWRFIKSRGLCYCCLLARHDKSSCPAPMCDVDNCGLPHHRLLHWEKPSPPTDEQQQRQQDPPQQPPPVACDDATVAHVAASVITQSASEVILKIVSVQLYGPNGVINTYALLDDAASVSMIDSDLADSLGLTSDSSTPIRFIDAFGLEVYQSDAPKVRTQINNCIDSVKYNITLRKVSKLKLPMQDLSVVNNLTCKHLLSVKGFVCNQCVVPRLLIGEDNYFLIAPLEIRHGHRNAPYATRCRLGWSIHGYCGRTHTSVSEPILHLAQFDEYNSSICELSELIRNSFDIDSVGISTVCRENKAHVRALQILEDTSRKVGKQWEVGLPFKKDEFSMPNSFHYALSRNKLLLRKFSKDSAYAKRYKLEIEKLFSNNYARELTDKEIESQYPHVWYLPHFGVQNPNKPGKLRLVFDAAGRVDSVCLNDYLITGPDLYNSLFGIMLRFREKKVAIMADIKDMFLRIRLRNEDQHVCRFLWQESADAPLVHCVMQSLIFGATCSPFIAQFIKNKNALKFEDNYPEAVNVILKNHYMDDCLYTVDDEQTAIRLVKEITSIHSSGGFEIRGWSSNSKQVLENIPADALAHSAIQFKDGATHTTERTLGLIWYTTNDTFGFSICLERIPESILYGNERPTKSKMLSIIMSVYDIHGLLSPFIIKSKILLQDVHRSGVDWQCCIRPEENLRWIKWLDELKCLSALRVPRWYDSAGAWTKCYESSDDSSLPTDLFITDIQMHIFCDASIKAYAAVVYWRFVRSNGEVKVCFVASKCRVSPLRPVSVPRLELQGALIAARLAKSVQKEHETLKPSKRFFWTDSSTVLQWISSDPRTYKPYVAFRLGEIDELTSTPEWRYVPTSLNIADRATREDSPPLQYDDVWFQGPEFLRRPEDQWPKGLKRMAKNNESHCEKRNVNFVLSHDTNKIDFSVPDESRFSSWTVLVRSAANLLVFIKRCQRQCIKINSELMSRAEELIIKKCQYDSFSSEILCIKQNKPILSTSKLLKLTPILDDRGILRVGGRIGKVDGVPSNAMQPCILDGRHKVSHLIIDFYHKRALHGANEMVVNEIRQRYWILKLRPTVRKISSECLFCRYRRAMPKPQRMADLPAARLQHNRRPFTFTGMDFFGPMEVTVGRGRQKRYGVIFTCLTIRAIHLEVTENLTTDSTLMALRRMSARRGQPSVIYSDNGTNLRGAATELKNSLEELNREKLEEYGSVRGIEWRFIPPGAPEMGGAWERMIRTVKTALKVVLKERAPHQETLVTLMAEVEALVNSRPITHVSVDPNYPEALTPNHFLIGTSSIGSPLGKYTDTDLSLRKRWRVAQRLTDMFWGRWIREYLPTLLPRQKWIGEAEALREGDYVLIVEPGLERGQWRHGVVNATHAGDDGRVRVVDVQTRTGVLRRPVTRVALLAPSDSSAE